jgi:hypothetical protein
VRACRERQPHAHGVDPAIGSNPADLAAAIQSKKRPAEEAPSSGSQNHKRLHTDVHSGQSNGGAKTQGATQGSHWASSTSAADQRSGSKPQRIPTVIPIQRQDPDGLPRMDDGGRLASTDSEIGDSELEYALEADGDDDDDTESDDLDGIEASIASSETTSKVVTLRVAKSHLRQLGEGDASARSTPSSTSMPGVHSTVAQGQSSKTSGGGIILATDGRPYTVYQGTWGKQSSAVRVTHVQQTHQGSFSLHVGHSSLRATRTTMITPCLGSAPSAAAARSSEA